MIMIPCCLVTRSFHPLQLYKRRGRFDGPHYATVECTAIHVRRHPHQKTIQQKTVLFSKFPRRTTVCCKFLFICICVETVLFWFFLFTKILILVVILSLLFYQFFSSILWYFLWRAFLYFLLLPSYFYLQRDILRTKRHDCRNNKVSWVFRKNYIFPPRIRGTNPKVTV